MARVTFLKDSMGGLPQNPITVYIEAWNKGRIVIVHGDTSISMSKADTQALIKVLSSTLGVFDAAVEKENAEYAKRKALRSTAIKTTKVKEVAK